MALGRSAWEVIDLAGLNARTKILDGATAARISPDGRWVAYQMRASGSGPDEVWVTTFPVPGGRRQISTNGGAAPVWGATSGELLYRARGSLWSATITTTPEFAVRRDSLFAMNVPAGALYDASPDGKTFVMPWLLGEENPPPVLVTGWFADLRQRLAAASRRQ
jgi:hypothetical protein